MPQAKSHKTIDRGLWPPVPEDPFRGSGCVGVTHWSRMRFLPILLVCSVALGQTSDADFKVYTEHPRLLLNARRLRLLNRERERQSPRWMQLETLIRGKARMSEPGFALALFGHIAGDPELRREAVAAAKRPGVSIREVALAFDWAAPDDAALRARLTQSLTAPVRDMASARDRAFASVALGDASGLRELISNWWRKEAAPGLASGQTRIAHSDLYPMVELFHVVRDNLQIDLKEEIPAVFRDLPIERVFSYYPAVWPASENEYRIPWYTSKGEPDLNLAALTRAGEMGLVAFESNAQETQFLQGWVQHDRFVLRGTFGAPYEFLWANPYQPGLPYEKLSLVHHDPRTGHLFARSTWDDDATWLGYFGPASGQLFRDGRIEPLRLKEPAGIATAMFVPGDRTLTRVEVRKDTPERWYILGLKPLTWYDVETGDESMFDARTDPGGTLVLDFRRRAGQQVYIHEPRVPQPTSP